MKNFVFDCTWAICMGICWGGWHPETASWLETYWLFGMTIIGVGSRLGLEWTSRKRKRIRVWWYRMHPDECPVCSLHRFMVQDGYKTTLEKHDCEREEREAREQ